MDLHEYSVASQIVRNVLEEAKKHRAKKVKEVSLVIGRLTFLGLEQIRFAYETLTRGTIMEGSNLLVKECEGIVECKSCKFKGAVKYEDNLKYHISTPMMQCSKCGGPVKIVRGKECIVKRVRLAT